jgi:hypothetical protein
MDSEETQNISEKLLRLVGYLQSDKVPNVYSSKKVELSVLQSLF